MRRWMTVVSLALILPAFLAAPLLHVHGEDSHGHEDLIGHGHEAVVHAHVPSPGGASDADSELDHSGSGHDGELLNISVSPASPPESGPSALRAESRHLDYPPAPSFSPLAAEAGPSLHPPPELGSFSLRAPPA